jgi:hypothetical protein
MSVPFWVADLANQFWAEAGTVEPFPRNLRRPITRAVPLSVVSLPDLRLDAIRTWLLQNGVVCPCPERDRPLRACLVARSGCGFAFIDRADPEDEQRFSLAHELAHFLRHYRQPRRQAARRLGERVSEVFDGLRPPTPEERIGSLLGDVPLGFQVHLLEREGGGLVSGPAVAAAEAEADRLAFELLAPAEAVQSAGTEALGEAGRAALVLRLRSRFGFPRALARAYAELLAPRPDTDPLLSRLGFGV